MSDSPSANFGFNFGNWRIKTEVALNKKLHANCGDKHNEQAHCWRKIIVLT